MQIDSGYPHTSVVIPVYNDAEGIQITLDSLVHQSYEDYEILPVDNNSTDSTPDVIAEFNKEYPDLIHPLNQSSVQSSYATRNTGIEQANGDILLFLDADMWVEKAWIENMVAAVESDSCDYIGCNVDVVTSENPSFPERFESALSFPVETYIHDKQFAPTCALAVRREVFDSVGQFNEQLESGGDKEFGQRVHKHGFKQCYSDHITAYHPARRSYRELVAKARRIGRGRGQRRFHLTDRAGDPHPLHPANFFPPSPWRLRRRYSGKQISWQTMVGFYCLEYFLKLVQTMSAIRETISLRHGN